VQLAQQITAIREMSDKPFLNRQLFNLNALFKRQWNKGLATTNALIVNLEAWGIIVKTRPGTNGFTEHIFVALPEAIELALQNQDVILVNNTYKTNKFDMLLLHMVGKSF
jgi:hypothetical protein